MSLTAENMNDRVFDRSQQVLMLLQELSERLRRSENERDGTKRELGSIRDMMQDLDDRNGQTQKAYLALENKLDGIDTLVESLVRRLTGMEEAVDGQSTQMLAILRKIEERFEAYDREYKNHASRITLFEDQLDRFDKRLEKLAQDKGRLIRKVEALEFQLAETADRVKIAGTGGPVIEGGGYDTAALLPPNLQVWSPETTRPSFMNEPETKEKKPRKIWFRLPSAVTLPPLGRWGQGVAVVLAVVVVGGLGYGAGRSLMIAVAPGSSDHVPVVAMTKPPVSAMSATERSEKATSGSVSPSENANDSPVTPVPSATATPTVAATTPVPVAAPVATPDIPKGELFSKTVRLLIDQQIVAARKLEDDDAARLMAMHDPRPLAQRLTRDKSLPRAIQAIEDKAAEGSPEAQHDMGALYTSGQSGVKIDYPRAAFWFREAAVNGIANARYNLGVLYQQGLGVEKDLTQALAWYRAAALLDHPEARYNLGIAYVEGIGTNYIPAMAAGYFEQAAKSGVVEAAYNLGLILENGLIDEARPYEGLFWYTLAADRGSTDAAASKKRLMAEMKIDDVTWATMYGRMRDVRPELKMLLVPALVMSSEAGPPPRVRVRTPGNAAANAPSEAPAMGPRKVAVPPPPPTVAAKSSAPKEKEIVDTDRQRLARIQVMLADEGILPDTGPTPPKGDADPLTIEAIRRYQLKYGLTADGKATDALMAHMLARRLSNTTEPAVGEGGKKNTSSGGVND